MAQKKSSLFSIYGARKSESGKRVNISLVKGEGDDKTFATISLKLEGTKTTKVKLDDEFVVIKIKRLDTAAKEADESEDF